MRINRIGTFFLVFLALASPAMAEITQVTLFPASALVEESAMVSISSGAAELILPAQADTSTLRVFPVGKGIKLKSVTITQRLATDSAAIEKLQASLDELKKQYETMQAKAASLESAIGFWQTLKLENPKSPDEAEQFAASVEKNIRLQTGQLLQNAREMEVVDNKMKFVKEQLQKATGNAKREWVASVAMAAGKMQQVTLKYDYKVNGCGWKPTYRVNALPDKGIVEMGFEAEVYQSTGQTWNARLRLATLDQRSPSKPPHLPAWIIKPMPKVETFAVAAPRMMKSMVNDEAMMETAAMRPEPNAAPVKTRKANYALWDLGQRVIKAGQKDQISIREISIPASYSRLVRPSRSSHAFLQADANATETLDMPQGLATILVDGAIVDKRNFAFAGRDKTISFGTDPLVVCKSILNEKQSGKTGIIGQRQSHAWKWTITLTNNRPEAVLVVVEEPKPQLRDEQIEAEFNYSIKPEETDDHKLKWNLNVPGESKQSIEWGVAINAPKDMDLSLGWR